MDSEDGLYADEDSAEEEVAHYLVGILQEQIPHPEVELQSAARTIRDLVRSSNALTKYYQRCLNRIPGNEIILPEPDGASAFQGKRRVEKVTRQRRRGDPRLKRPFITGNDRANLQAENDDDPYTCSSIQHEDSQTTTPDGFSLSQKQIIRSKDVFKAYRCVYCDKRCATKGNTRKHIETQHVSKKLQQCSRCGERSSTIPRADHHSKVCPKADKRTHITPFDEAKDDRKVFGSEFTGQYFSSRRGYVDHLLYLSERLAGSAPPIPSMYLKFMALLGQPAIHEEWMNVRHQWLGTVVDLPGLEWSEDQMENAIRLLEMGIVDVEPGPVEALRRNEVRPFLEHLMFAGFHEQFNMSQALSAGPEMLELGMDASAGSADPTLLYDNDASLASYSGVQNEAQALDYQQDMWRSTEIDEAWSEEPFDGEPRLLDYPDANQPTPNTFNAITDNPRQRWNTAPATTTHDISESRQVAPAPSQLNWSLNGSRIAGHSTAHESSFEYSMPSFAQPANTYAGLQISQDISMPVCTSSQDHLTQSASRLHVLQQPGQWQ